MENTIRNIQAMVNGLKYNKTEIDDIIIETYTDINGRINGTENFGPSYILSRNGKIIVEVWYENFKPVKTIFK